MLGLPAKWSMVMFWLTATSTILPTPTDAPIQKPRIYTNIPVLQDYEKDPHESFWYSFPSNNLPDKPETKINVIKLSELIEKNQHLLLRSVVSRAKKCVEFLTSGAPAFQHHPLPGCRVKNLKNLATFGASVTDTIASWVKKKFVAGPFSTPPMPGFRANSVLAVPQPS
jgi:hypothetical protein